jgi:ABC-type transport system involved in multi-copper enzyme maturation permease subunit
LELLAATFGFARIAAHQALRDITSVRTWALVCLVVGYAVVAMRAESGAVALGAGVAPSAALATGVGLQVVWLLALAAPIAAGDTFAGDRADGYAALQLTRGLGRATSVAIRSTAALLAAGACASVTCSATAIGAWLMYPGPQSARVRGAVPFAPGLLESSLLAWVVLITITVALATWALLATSLLVAALVPSMGAAQALPPLGVLLLGLSMTGDVTYPFNPFERLSFLQVHGVGWNRPAPLVAYWLGAGLVLSTCAALAYRRSEVP